MAPYTYLQQTKKRQWCRFRVGLQNQGEKKKVLCTRNIQVRVQPQACAFIRKCTNFFFMCKPYKAVSHYSIEEERTAAGHWWYRWRQQLSGLRKCSCDTLVCQRPVISLLHKSRNINLSSTSLKGYVEIFQDHFTHTFVIFPCVFQAPTASQMYFWILIQKHRPQRELRLPFEAPSKWMFLVLSGRTSMCW